MTVTPEQLLAERKQRLLDAYALKQPDRVPISIGLGYMLAKIGGITHQELETNPDKAQELLEKWALYFQPDAIAGQGLFTSIPSTILGDRQTKWPGFGLPPNQPFQFVEGEYMKAEEYDDFLMDPTNFTLRKFLPRAFKELEGLADLPWIPIMMIGYQALPFIGRLNTPSVATAMRAVAQAAEHYAEMSERGRANAQRMQALGFPVGVGAGPLVMAPFDFMSDTMRGMRGIFLDMYRRPDKVIASCEKARRIIVDVTIQACQMSGAKFCSIPLHRGSDGFMSISQFETFYWPSFKGMMCDLVDAGIMPVPFYEGVWDNRLHYLNELPKGKTGGRFQSSNIFKVKEVCGENMVLLGGFPVSLLQGGTPDQVRDLTKQYCQIAGKGGGFIMTTNTAMDECNPELVKVWIDATKEFGVY